MDRNHQKVSIIKTHLFIIECEFYTEEQLKPRAQRLTQDYIDIIQSKYVNEDADDDADEASDEDSEMEGDDEHGNDRTKNRHSFPPNLTP